MAEAARGLWPSFSRNVRCRRRTASSSRTRSIIQVMRNDDVAIPSMAAPLAVRAFEPRRTLANDALMPAPTTLIAPRVSAIRTPSPNRAASASRICPSPCRFSRDTTSVS